MESVEVQLYEGAVEDGRLVDTIDLPWLPQIGAKMTFATSAGTFRYQVVAIDHVFSSRTVGAELVTEQDHIICSLMKL